MAFSGERLKNYLIRNPDVVVRISLLPLIWGLVLAAWFSLTQVALRQYLPELAETQTKLAQSYAVGLASLTDKAKALANDSRVSAKADDESDLARRRALYEFSYLNRTGNVYVLSADGSGVWAPSGAQPLPVTASALLAGAVAGRGNLVAVKASATTLLLATASNPAGDALAVHRLEWADAALSLPPLPTMTDASGDAPVTFKLAARLGTTWRSLDPATGKVQTLAEYPSISQGGLAPTVETRVQVPGWPDWAVVAHISTLQLGHGIWLLKMALLAAGMVFSILLFAKKLERPAGFVTRKVSSIGQRVKAALATAHEPLSEPGQYAGYLGRSEKRRGHSIQLGESKRLKAMRVSAEPAKAGSDTPDEPGESTEDKQRRVQEQDRLLQIRQALAGQRIRLLYQPVFRANDGMPQQHEVLLRLLDRKGEDIPPGEFLPIAKKENLLPELDAAAFRQVMLEHFKGHRTPATRLALNVSATTMDSLGYVRELMESTTPEVLSQLVFELRSRELLNDPQALDFLYQLKGMGAQLSVDYFGGGLAMIEGCRQMGIDYIKLNAQDFWEPLSKRKELVGLAQAAKRMKIPVILEKIEHINAEVFARRIGIPYLQGYHFAKPGVLLTTERLKGWRDLEQTPDASGRADQPRQED